MDTLRAAVADGKKVLTLMHDSFSVLGGPFLGSIAPYKGLDDLVELAQSFADGSVQGSLPKSAPPALPRTPSQLTKCKNEKASQIYITSSYDDTVCVKPSQPILTHRKRNAIYSPMKCLVPFKHSS